VVEPLCALQVHCVEYFVDPFPVSPVQIPLHTRHHTGRE
jgi:hypothetical protein